MSTTEKRTRKTHAWSVKDVITTVLMSVLLIIIQLAVNIILMVNDFVSLTLSIGVAMFLCGPIYFLMISRVQKHFVSLIYMTLLGLVFLLMGNWYLFPYLILVGLVTEAILWSRSSFANPRRLTAAWTVASLLYNGINLLPIWFFWDTFTDFVASSGLEQSYIDSYLHYYTTPGWLVFIIVFTTLCGFIGSLIGQRLSKKHFEKAGVL